jgi:pilus assembly protein CpaF
MTIPDGPYPASRRAGRDELVETVRRRLADSGQPATAAHLAALLRDEAGARGDTDRLTMTATLRSQLSGLGPLEPLLADADVTDILVNGPDEVWVDRGHGLERAPVSFGDDEAVRRLAVRLAGSVGRRLDTASPFVDARLPDGSRAHAVLRPISLGGTCLSVRVLGRRSFTLGHLTQRGTLPAGFDELLSAMVRARLAILVSGGTGTGKTTLLGVLCSLVDASERLVVAEDAAELCLDHPHAVRLEARPPNVEGAGAITLRDLVRQALRMRPDRLIVGEVRGGEVADLLLALNTGHDGGMSTVHANSARDVPARLEALAGLAGLGREALHSQLASAVQAVIHLGRASGGQRQVREIALLARGDDGLVRAVPAAAGPGGPGDGPATARQEGAGMLGRLIASRGVTVPAVLRAAP